MANYLSYEIKQGAVLERVEALCRHLTTGGSFTDSSPITLPEVEQYIDDAYYWVQGELVHNGYSTTQANEAVKGVLQQLQGLDAAVQVEFSQPVTASGEPNDRYRAMVARRDHLVKTFLKTTALQELGATRSADYSAYLDATGRSVTRKRTVYGDSDVPQSRFPRGFGQRPDVPSRSGTETSGGADPSVQ